MNLAFQSLVKIYKEEEEGYRHIRIVQIYSNKLLKEGTKASNIKEVINSFRMLISACQSNKPPPDSQVIGLYFSINITVKASFRLNNLPHVVSSLRIVNSQYSRYPSLSKYPKSQQIEFKFNEGKYHIHENNIEEATECLDFAFKYCHKDSVKNKKVILKYLIPLNLLKKKFPTDQLLSRHSLDNYKDLVKIIKQGDVSRFNKYLQENQYKFLQQGILLVMESLKMLVFRNLFKKVFSILGETQAKMQSFQKALAGIGANLSIFEVECIFNSLIEKNWVKGQINSPLKLIIFRENNPFPK